MRRPDPVEIAQIAVPVLIEALCAIVFIGAAMALVIVLATPMPL